VAAVINMRERFIFFFKAFVAIFLFYFQKAESPDFPAALP